MAEAILNPTPDQTFRIEGRGDYDFSRTLRLSDEAQRRGAVDEACNLRFHAFQHLADLIPDNEEVILEWEHPNTQAALHLLYRSAVDHFLIDDFELSAAMLEFLLDLDPEDHEEATWLLAFDYVALADYDAFDEVINDVSDKYPEKPLLTLWSEYRRHGSLPAGEAIRLRNHFAPYYKEFTADSHPADDAYLRDIESERPTPQAQARELWLKTENLWTAFPGFIAALKALYYTHERAGGRRIPCDGRPLVTETVTPSLREAGRSSGGRSVRKNPARPASPAFRRPSGGANGAPDCRTARRSRAPS